MIRRPQDRRSPERWRVALLLAACIGAGVVPPQPAAAQQPEADSRIYDVELVVFRNLNAASFATPEVAPLPDELEQEGVLPAEPLPLEPPPALAPEPLPEGITDLPAEQHTLNAIENALKRSANYRPIAHIGWSQPAYPRGLAPAVPLDQQLEGTGLTGSARLAVGRFLHLDLELTYQSEDGQIRTLTTSRRMRNGERHYFDDPVFGVIAVVSRRDEAR